MLLRSEVLLLCLTHLAGSVFAVQEVLYKFGTTWLTLTILAGNSAAVIAVVLACCYCCCAGPLWPVYDLCPCRSSCPPPAAGHWATFTPLTGLRSTLLFLPLDSSIFLTKLGHRSSMLFLLLSFISTWFSFSKEEGTICKCFAFSSIDSASLFVLFAVRLIFQFSVSLHHQFKQMWHLYNM